MINNKITTTKMKNREFIEDWLNPFRAGHGACGNLSCDRKRLYSYSTVIAEFDDDGKLHVNMAQYSVTTSRYRNEVIRAHKRTPVGDTPVIEHYDVPRGAYTLL